MFGAFFRVLECLGVFCFVFLCFGDFQGVLGMVLQVWVILGEFSSVLCLLI